MKNACIVMFLVFGLVAMASAADLDYVKLKGVDSAVFQAGSSMQRIYGYIVDRTMGMCFSFLWTPGQGGGLVKIDCDTLKKNEIIKNYIDTGKLP